MGFEIMFDNGNKDFVALSNINKLPGEYRSSSEPSENYTYLKRQEKSESNARSYPRKLPFALAQAKGIYLKDVDGNVYYDCLSGAGAIALGHNHDVVHEAIRTQLDQNLPLLTLDITTPVKDAFVQEILQSLPEEFAKNAKIQFCGPSGSDAVEAAIKLVKIATGRQTMMAFQGGYHGMTNGALSMMGNLNSKGLAPSLMPGVQMLPYPYIYRCPMGSMGDPDSDATIQYIENLLKDDESGVIKPAGIIVETIQGEGGKIPAPNKWMQSLRRITKEHDIPLIIDEVQTGFGRTGKMFAFEHSGIIPDVIVMSKALGGSLPLAIIAYHKDLDVWGPGAHAGTFRGNQLAMATGMATIQHIKSHNLCDNAAKMGALLMEKLDKMKTISPYIGDVRGRGLMLGVEIVKPLAEATQMKQPEHFGVLAKRIQFECFSRGLIIEIGGRGSSVLRFMPPLIITAAQVDHICSIFQEALRAAEDFIVHKHSA